MNIDVPAFVGASPLTVEVKKSDRNRNNTTHSIHTQACMHAQTHTYTQTHASAHTHNAHTHTHLKLHLQVERKNI